MEGVLASVQALLNFLRDFGFYGVLMIIIILIVHNPERVTQIKAILFTPLYRIFRIGGQQYIAANICYTVTQFLRNHLAGVCRLSAVGKIKLRWVTSRKDPILRQSGTIILRMKDTEDQSLNLINATRQALPIVLCPFVRSNLEPYFQTAIDLTVLRKLADGIGQHAKVTFQKHFLAPETAADVRVGDAFRKLVEVDTRGIFVAVFLNELERAGESLYGAGDTNDKTTEVESLLDYLLTVARRKAKENIDLEYSSDMFRFAIVLIAIDSKARQLGVAPYVSRIDINIRKGCESIYLIAYSRQMSFLDKVLAVVEGDARVTIVRRMKVKCQSEVDTDSPDTLKVGILHRNAIVHEDDFTDKLKESGIKTGDIVCGTVVDVAEKKSTVDVSGLLAIVSWQECAWGMTTNCLESLEVGKSYEFSVLTIEESKHRMELSRRLPDNDPWASIPVPEIGESVRATISSKRNGHLIGATVSGLQIGIPLDEIAWINPSEKDIESLLGGEVEAKLIECDQENRVLRCSIRQMTGDPWPAIKARYPRKTKLRGTVVEVSTDNVRVELEPRTTGLISADEMVKGGYELIDFQETVMTGQGLDVVVLELYPRRRKIRLGLQRNL